MARSIFILTLFLITPVILFSQNKNEIKSLSSTKNFSSGGYGGFSVGYTRTDDNNAFILGGKGAWIINHSLGIGGALYGYSHIKYFENGYIRGKSGGYTGLLIEPVIRGTQVINVSVPLIFGGGGYILFNDYISNYTAFTYFIFVPGVELNITLTKHFRMALGLDYRLTTKNNSTIIDSEVTRGFSVHLVFKFGKF